MSGPLLRLAHAMFLRLPSGRDGRGSVGSRPAETTDADDDDSRFHRAFEKIRAQLRGRLWRVLGNAADLDDVLQDTYLQAWDRRHTIREQDASGFFFRIAANLAIDRKRRDARRPVVVADEALLLTLPDAITPERLLIARRDLQAVQAALERLPLVQRRALDLSDDGKTLAEIAAALGCSTTSAWRHLRAAGAAIHAACDPDQPNGKNVE
jgi:RNA polymerase sigma-70 factor (ECF subfamily)